MKTQTRFQSAKTSTLVEMASRTILDCEDIVLQCDVVSAWILYVY